ncbi:glycine cleavage system protein H [Thermosipho africanus H17ap60334]|jgi:glycine cleavage system H protein|uniref:glycine cleavage system protein GcvH n=1 Tax=Thermosipho TaxID=2420 RepID=UPI00028E4C36|nr:MULTISPECIES: glycine cleavage system protein GcvH [Thermosipho]MDI3478303.1 glycine cleavage system protein [Thermoanaerobacterium sp.]HCF37643.1 glycine cleavage system protein GcvH [Thermosipho africanus]EKF49084.1 glycine cleavage system protein H [Thermosipho africanus H17ap60334]MBZ4649702.1 gcvH [Thermosipho sp. (in: thermotogales)]RDI91160.1 glycine cleavage system protein H [Thermosipho africanus Ob7]
MKKFTKTHEWVDENGYVGITSHAQEELGDIVYVDLPEVGKEVKKGDVLLSIESVKAASDVYAPISGKIVEVNSELDARPELVNEDAEGEGWLVKIEISNPSELDELMTEEEYKEFLNSEGDN